MRGFSASFAFTSLPTARDNYWRAIAEAWAPCSAGLIMGDGMEGGRVIADVISFQKWRSGRDHDNKQPLPEGCVPELITKHLPRGIVPGGRNGQVLTAPEAWDESEASGLVWTQRELDLGISKRIERGNSFECNKGIPEDLAKKRAIWKLNSSESKGVTRRNNP